MPLYEYKCQDRGLHYERLEHVSAMHDGTCPECGGNSHRLIGAPALQFKGSGWYVTDYGKGNGNGSKPTAKERETAQLAAESATDTKPKKKAEKKADTKVA